MIRLAKENDAIMIANIIVTTWKTAYKGIIDQEYANNLSLNKYTNLFSKIVAGEKEIIYVNEDNFVNGFISGVLLNEKYDCEIRGLYVLPEYQGNGIGQILVNTLIDVFKKNNKTNLLVWTLDKAKNNGFYEYLGAKKEEYKDLLIGSRKYDGVGYNLKL